MTDNRTIEKLMREFVAVACECEVRDYLISEYAERIEQTIATTLNSRECKVINHYYYDDYDIHKFELSCGHLYTTPDDILYSFCPICSAKIRD